MATYTKKYTLYQYINFHAIKQKEKQNNYFLYLWKWKNRKGNTATCAFIHQNYIYTLILHDLSCRESFKVHIMFKYIYYLICLQFPHCGTNKGLSYMNCPLQMFIVLILRLRLCNAIKLFISDKIFLHRTNEGARYAFWKK